jgi:Uma2 family endonuclease
VQHGLRRRLTYSDYLAIPEDGSRHEILAGSLVVTPSPRPAHQRVVLRLAMALEAHFRHHAGTEVFVSPIDLILTPHDILQPDLLVIDDPRSVTDRGIEGTPLLVIEVLSKGTAVRDRGRKARRYAELGIPHYWLVDPDARRVEAFRLTGHRYGLAVSAEKATLLRVPGFADLEIPLAPLWSPSDPPERN